MDQLKGEAPTTFTLDACAPHACALYTVHWQNPTEADIRTIIDMDEIKDDGTYPDLSSESELWREDVTTSTAEAKVISIYKEAGNCPLPWFTKGPLPAGLVNSAASALEVDYDDAYKFCKTWFVSALDENLLIWRARNHRTSTVMTWKTSSHGLS
jgi:hypothetical protein